MIINRPNLETAFKGFRAVFKEGFDAAPANIDKVAMRASSTTGEEEYGWLGDFPALREWIGDRVVKNMTAHGFRIKNRLFESTVRVRRVDMEDDKFGLYKPMFQEAGRASKTHPDELAFELLKTGFSATCYDGQNFFDGDHPVTDPATDATISVSNMQAGTGAAWFLIDGSRAFKPVILQERMSYELQALDDNSGPHAFWRDEYLYGVRARANAGFGLWQLAFGSKAPLTAENLRAAYQAMTLFKSDAGKTLAIKPTMLLVGPTLHFTARDILLSEIIDATSNTDRNLLEIVYSPWLD